MLPDHSRGPVVTGEVEPSLQQVLAVLLRRKWIVLASIAFVPIAAVVLSAVQGHVYSATARVLLSDLNLATSLTGVQNPSGAFNPQRVAATQATLARVSLVAQRTLVRAHIHDRTAQDFLNSSAVTPESNADILDFTVSDSNQARAQRLATGYAEAYITYRRQLDTAALENARSDLESRLASLSHTSTKHTSATGGLLASLEATDQKLRTMEALQTSNALLVQPAGPAQQTAPKTKRNGLLGLGLGIVLGIGLAFLWDALDLRVRSPEEISQYLGAPLLGRIAASRRRFREQRLVMLDDPASFEAEAYRVLRTNLELANLDLGARMILMASALEAEGKSETAANLAIAMARSGKHVILADLDLRRPSVRKFFRLFGPRAGIVEVAKGHVALNDALVRVPLDMVGSDSLTESISKTLKAASNGGRDLGTLELLLAGSIPSNPGEFIGTDALAKILASLRERADVVILDSPASLQVGDGIALSRRVDAVLVVVDAHSVRRNSLKELRRVLAATPTPTLGFVLVGGDEELSYELVRDRGRLRRYRLRPSPVADHVETRR